MLESCLSFDSEHLVAFDREFARKITAPSQDDEWEGHHFPPTTYTSFYLDVAFQEKGTVCQRRAPVHARGAHWHALVASPGPCQTFLQLVVGLHARLGLLGCGEETPWWTAWAAVVGSQRYPLETVGRRRGLSPKCSAHKRDGARLRWRGGAWKAARLLPHVVGRRGPLPKDGTVGNRTCSNGTDENVADHDGSTVQVLVDDQRNAWEQEDEACRRDHVQRWRECSRRDSG